MAPATRHNELANLRSFYRWAMRWEYRDDDPTRRIDSPRVDPGLPRPMTREDLHKAIDQLYRPDIRRAVCLGAYAGLRISEAAALSWADVDLENRQL
jgi:integrase